MSASGSPLFKIRSARLPSLRFLSPSRDSSRERERSLLPGLPPVSRRISYVSSPIGCPSLWRVNLPCSRETVGCCAPVTIADRNEHPTSKAGDKNERLFAGLTMRSIVVPVPEEF